MFYRKSLGSRLFDVFNYALLVLLSLSMLLPFIHILAVSLSDSLYVMAGQVTLWPRGFTFFNYVRVLHDPTVLLSYRNTVFYTVVGTLISILFTAMTGYALANRLMIFRKSLTVLFVFPMMFGGGLIPTYLVIRALGMVDTIWAIIIPGAVGSWSVLVMRTFFLNLPYELEEAAKIDGMSEIGVFFTIVLPLSKALLATMSLFCAVGLWNSYFTPLIYINSRNKFPLQIYLQNMLTISQKSELLEFSSGGQTKMIAIVIRYTTIMVATLPIICVYPFLQKYFVKGTLLGSLKG